MTTKPCSARALFALAAILLTSSVAHGVGSSRVFVSARSGNDANSCDNINTPCQTFAGAVLQLNPGGEAIVLDSGGYGPVTITQSLIIEAPPGVLAFIHPPSGGDAVTVNAVGATIVLRGSSIDGAAATTGNGVKVVAVGFLHVENCVITGFGGITGPHGSGIYFASAGLLFVKDTIIRGNGEEGIAVIPSSGTASASVDQCRVEQNAAGLGCGGSGGSVLATIRNSVASGNTVSGLEVSTGGELNAEGCLVANNTNYGLACFGSILRASNCTVTDNGVGLNPANGGTMLSRSNNTVEGNGVNGSFTGTYSAK